MTEAKKTQDPTLHKNFVTPEGTLSFTDQVWEKGALPGNNQGYSCGYLMEKDDKKALELVKKAIWSAFIAKFGKNKDDHPVEWDNPLRDGDKKAAEMKRKKKNGESFEGRWYMVASSKDRPGNAASAPGVVGPDTRPMLNQSDLYSGCKGRIHVNFYGYEFEGKAGVGVGLLNVMKVADGDRLDGRVGAEAAFGEYAAEKADDEAMDFD